MVREIQSEIHESLHEQSTNMFYSGDQVYAIPICLIVPKMFLVSSNLMTSKPNASCSLMMLDEVQVLHLSVRASICTAYKQVVIRFN